MLEAAGKFELFVNSKQLEFTGPESELITLHDDDIVFLRAKNSTFDDDQGVKIDFVARDGTVAWPAKREEFKIVDVDAPEHVTAAMLHASPNVPLTGHAGPEVADAWTKLDVLGEDQSEWMWWNSSDLWWQCAAKVRTANFQFPNGQPRPLAELQTASSPTPSDGPPTDAVEFNGHHYKIFHKFGIPWNVAKEACEKMGGHLACPITREQMEFVVGLPDSEAVLDRRLF